MKEILTVTKGLKELKLSMDKINSKIDDINPYLMYVGGSSKDGLSKGEAIKFIDNQKAILDSISTNMRRRTAIKNAIVVSNAKKEVEIGSNKMTVAEAIERKNAISLEKELLATMNMVKNRFNSEYQRLSDNQEDKAQSLLTSLMGREKTQGGSKELESQMNSIKENFKITTEWAYDIDKLIREKEEEIEKFELEVDDVLAVSNATTKIEINY